MSRYISKHPKPTPYERELLTILMEEAAEVIVMASKILRFGAGDGYPGSGTVELWLSRAKAKPTSRRSTRFAAGLPMRPTIITMRRCARRITITASTRRPATAPVGRSSTAS